MTVLATFVLREGALLMRVEKGRGRKLDRLSENACVGPSFRHAKPRLSVPDSEAITCF